jgi:hypothetical protein
MGCSHSDLYMLGGETGRQDNEIDTSKFTLEEIDTIRSSWKLIDDKKEFGMAMMIK